MRKPSVAGARGKHRRALTFRTGFSLPKRATFLGLRAQMLAVRTCTRHGRADALAEEAARKAPANAIDGRRERWREVRTGASEFLGEID